MYSPELLSPVGDFDCLKAAVQNGANSVYLGASLFSARASATNFDLNELDRAVNYAKLRGVNVHLALNTLIKNDEFETAISLAKAAYEIGVDAIIVQDFGLAMTLLDLFPDLPIHASTQMTVHNLEGVQALEKLGFKRVVLSRELSISEIENICKNSNCEIEAFVHGALCVSYSGQCLFSSMIGGRSGNRGKCAQPCRLPYELIDDNDMLIDKGFLLSPRDLFSLDFLPRLTNAKVDCFKIEGRMKTPEYVATVTRIYRKYLDMALNKQDYVVSEQDKQDLLQVFNRGGFSSGHLDDMANRNFVFKDKPNNMGIYLGDVYNFDNKKGYVGLKLKAGVSVGDKICIDFDGTSNFYHVSELMIKHNNEKNANSGDFVTIGRMKGNIKCGNKVYKLEDKELLKSAFNSYSNTENKRIPLIANVTVKKGETVKLDVCTDSNSNLIANDIKLSFDSNIIPTEAINSPITEDRIVSQLCKTKNTIFDFKQITVDLEDNLYIPNISVLNQLRRDALEAIENIMVSRIKRKIDNADNIELSENVHTYSEIDGVSLFLNIINLNFDYTKLNFVNRIYIPLKFFLKDNYSQILQKLCKTFSIYIAMPTITRKNYTKYLNFSGILEKFDIKGFVVSQLGQIEPLKQYGLELIANYNFNVYNSSTVNRLQKLGISTFTISPELDKVAINDLAKLNGSEMIVYGATPIMNTNYCVLGRANHCYSDCKKLCTSGSKFYLKDRMGFLFRVIPDNIDTVSTIYNSKVTSVSFVEFMPNSVRIDILDESIDKINDIISTVLNGGRCEGKEYTNSNLNRSL